MQVWDTPNNISIDKIGNIYIVTNYGLQIYDNYGSYKNRIKLLTYKTKDDSIRGRADITWLMQLSFDNINEIYMLCMVNGVINIGDKKVNKEVYEVRKYTTKGVLLGKYDLNVNDLDLVPEHYKKIGFTSISWGLTPGYKLEIVKDSVFVGNLYLGKTSASKGNGAVPKEKLIYTPQQYAGFVLPDTIEMRCSMEYAGRDMAGNMFLVGKDTLGKERLMKINKQGGLMATLDTIGVVSPTGDVYALESLDQYLSIVKYELKPNK